MYTFHARMQALSELRGVEVDLSHCFTHTHTHTQALSELRGVEVDLDSVQTNIVLFRLPAGNAHKVFAAGVHSCMASLSSYLHGRMYGV